MDKTIRKERVYSLDALRGFDMLWIIGGGSFIAILAKSTGWEWIQPLATQMEHVEWEGFRFYDLIFPLFMFISGAVIPYSIFSKLKEGASKKRLLLKTARRLCILIFFGLIYNGVLRKGFSDARYVSVLAQIGFAYFFTVLIVLFSDSQVKRLMWLLGILAGIAFLQLFVSVPGVGSGVLTPEGHINGYIDRMLLPGRLAYGNGVYDALGILSTVSSIGITLMGFFAGILLKAEKFSGIRKVGLLAVFGICLIILGVIISPFYPPIKKCWTSTYTLLAGGTSFLLVGLFYLIVDVWGYQKWSFFFRIIGMNSITIYLATRIINFWHTSEFLLGWLSKLLGSYGSVVIVLGVIGIEWLMLYYMYKNKIFFKV